MTTTIRLRGPADIITVLPYHLGYRPADSLVLALLDGSRIGMVARVDLPSPGVDPWAVVDELVPFVVRECPDRAVIVGFETRPGQAEACSVALRDGLADVGIDAVERLLVRGERWWGLDCNSDCCPPGGTAVLPDDRVPAVSDYVALGRFPAPSRDQLAERLTHTDDPGQDALCAALIHELDAGRRSTRAQHRRRRRVVEAWGRILRSNGDGWSAGPAGYAGSTRTDAPCPSEEDWAWAVVGLLDVTVRDLLIAWLCPGTLELTVFSAALRRLADEHLPPRGRLPPALAKLAALPDLGADEGTDDRDGRQASALSSETLVERLAMVCRRSPRELSPGPLTVVGHVSWWLGDGALARTAVEGALAVDPDYRLAVLLSRMVDVAIRPPRTA
jgi:hypothetical protein